MPSLQVECTCVGSEHTLQRAISLAPRRFTINHILLLLGSAADSSMSAFITPPKHCRWAQDGDNCGCPEFEPEDEDNTSPLGLCDTCEHQSIYHSPKVHLTPQQARDIKAGGGKAREYCKAKKGGLPCDCPCYIGSQDDKICQVCQCKAGWHLYKEVEELQPEVSRRGAGGGLQGILLGPCNFH